MPDAWRLLAAQMIPMTGPAPSHKPAAPAAADGQMMLFTQYLPHPAIDQLREIKMDTLSPMQAFDLLRELRDRVVKPS